MSFNVLLDRYLLNNTVFLLNPSEGTDRDIESVNNWLRNVNASRRDNPPDNANHC